MPSGPDLDEPGLAQHLEVLGDAGLAEVETLHEVVHRPLAVAQEIEDLAAGRLGDGGVGGHAALILPDGNMKWGASSSSPAA